MNPEFAKKEQTLCFGGGQSDAVGHTLSAPCLELWHRYQWVPVTEVRACVPLRWQDAQAEQGPLTLSPHGCLLSGTGVPHGDVGSTSQRKDRLPQPRPYLPPKLLEGGNSEWKAPVKIISTLAWLSSQPRPAHPGAPG